MISITPQGDIYLCKTPLENDYKNQLTFSNETSQLNYFNSKIFKTLDNYTYIKKDNYIKVGFPIDEIIGCNYLFYRNEGFTTKYYFCFITNMEYINENCTGITFETDVWQTYQFNLTYNPCFVEREHVNNDTIGLHTIPENLELGEYVTQYINNTQENPELTNMFYLSDVVIVAAVTTIGLAYAIPQRAQQSEYNGIYSGLYYLAFKTPRDFNLYLEEVHQNISEDNIVSLFIAPTELCQFVESDWDDTSFNFEFAFVPTSTTEIDMGDIAYTKPDHLDKDYFPRNKKLLTFPFCYLNITNNAGTVCDYHYELFKDSECPFNIKGSIGVGCSIKMYPYDYATGNSTNLLNKLYSISANKLPTCTWLNDTYTNWLTSQAVNMPLQFTKDITSIGFSGATGNASGIANGLFGIASSMATVYERSLIPPTARGGSNEADLSFAQRHTFNIYPMSIKKEYAEIIDKYFDMFGYKVNTVKIPNINGRANWNFVKTIECNFEGDIPQNHLQIIKQIFNNGVTLWHNPNTMYNYNNSNNIVS